MRKVTPEQWGVVVQYDKYETGVSYFVHKTDALKFYDEHEKMYHVDFVRVYTVEEV